jgi:hypothetical protein
MKYYFDCPNCHNDDEFTHPQEESSGMGGLLFFFGGLIPALLYADHTCRRVQCSRCGYIFRQSPLPRTSLSLLAVWITGIVLLFLVVTALAIAFPDIVSLIPDSPLLLMAEKVVASHPRAILLGLLPMLVLIVLTCAVASWTSNYRAHKEMRRQWETRPKAHAEKKTETPARASTGQ